VHFVGLQIDIGDPTIVYDYKDFPTKNVEGLDTTVKVDMTFIGYRVLLSELGFCDLWDLVASRAGD
jgi:hypothetical protein